MKEVNEPNVLEDVSFKENYESEKIDSDTYPKPTIAVVQAAPIYNNRDATIKKVRRLIACATFRRRLRTRMATYK